MSELDELREWLAEAGRVLASVDTAAVARVVDALAAVRDAGGTIFVAGNGGSALAAGHFALDLQKTARTSGGRTRAAALADNVGLVTAWANDTSFDRVFAEQIAAMARPGDALVILSVSGSSPNLIAAVREAQRQGLLTIGLLGTDGGAARALVSHAIVVPSGDYGFVESAHAVVHHVIAYALRARRAGVGAAGRAGPAQV